MRAIVRHEYGSPDVLELQDIDKPVAKDDEVLVRVHAAGVNMADVDYLLGRPKSARLVTGLRGPRNRVLGLDVAGHVEAVGPVHRLPVADAIPRRALLIPAGEVFQSLALVPTEQSLQ